MNEANNLQISTETAICYEPMLAAAFSHRELCKKAAKFLKSKGIQPFHKCQYVVCELERATGSESPDAFGICNNSSQLIEVKVSRSDFLADKRKWFRQNPKQGIGDYRSYLCPEGVIKKNDLPEKWGLLWINDKGKIFEVLKPEKQEACKQEEIYLMMSILRRENIKPQIFSYKKYACDAVS